jgi:hypothetical protein
MDGVLQVGVLHTKQHCQQAGAPIMLCLSEMDRPFVQVKSIRQDLEESVDGIKPIPLQPSTGTGI